MLSYKICHALPLPPPDLDLRFTKKLALEQSLDSIENCKFLSGQDPNVSDWSCASTPSRSEDWGYCLKPCHPQCITYAAKDEDEEVYEDEDEDEV